MSLIAHHFHGTLDSQNFRGARPLNLALSAKRSNGVGSTHHDPVPYTNSTTAVALLNIIPSCALSRRLHIWFDNIPTIKAVFQCVR